MLPESIFIDALSRQAETSTDRPPTSSTGISGISTILPGALSPPGAVQEQGSFARAARNKLSLQSAPKHPRAVHARGELLD